MSSFFYFKDHKTEVVFSSRSSAGSDPENLASLEPYLKQSITSLRMVLDSGFSLINKLTQFCRNIYSS